MKAQLNPFVLTFMERMMCDAIVMASYIKGHDRPTFMDDHIEHCQRTFGVEFGRWDEQVKAIGEVYSELWEADQLIADLVGDWPSSARSNALDAARKYLASKE